ncbi:ABC transporter ATP-binding protein [Cuneatibacter sp. NSJ-177]|uniref:ABC transporter ATP-binding protein n=1 Tax=Cuneatibacter sp. NSJ-177 TaxID=2931401 RepID=UPI001FD31EA2|nr:ABC transporter ATP-binding protein [Cuneatibacter sp. NSJ-177]MCJ7835853.1 ABC transporter ATP-binding protein [Cuneatibacter sp. NSJ-177]
MSEVLKVVDVTQRFGGLVALAGIHLYIKPGEIVGIIGPNGAGKTTLFNVITGIYHPTEGKVYLEGADITSYKTHQIAKAGFARTFQNIRLFGKLSVMDNVIAGMHTCRKTNLLDAILHTKRRRREGREAQEKAESLLKLMDLWEDRHSLASALPYGHQRRLEIARALATEPKLLLLDEPAAGMNEQETLELREMVLQLKKMGLTILLIEHDMKFVMNICERIYVLNHGELIAQGTPKQVSQDQAVIEAYLGEEE